MKYPVEQAAQHPKADAERKAIEDNIDKESEPRERTARNGGAQRTVQESWFELMASLQDSVQKRELSEDDQMFVAQSELW
jgi:hypothetical protein